MPSEVTFARQTDLETLYKFRSCEDAIQIGRVKDILDGELYLSTCDQLNDPFEFRVRVEPDKDQDKIRKFILSDLKNFPKLKKMSPLKRLEFAENHSRRLANDPGLREELARKHYERMSETVHLYSLSGNCEHPLLWSHYANEHRGVCIGFKARPFPFAGACRVSYSDKYPVLRFPFGGGAEILQIGLFTKADYWAYEEEFRIFSMKSAAPQADYGITWKDDHRATCNTPCTEKLIFGARCPDEIRKELGSYAEAQHPGITLEEAVLCNDRFAVRI